MTYASWTTVHRRCGSITAQFATHFLLCDFFAFCVHYLIYYNISCLFSYISLLFFAFILYSNNLGTNSMCSGQSVFIALIIPKLFVCARTWPG